MRQALGHGWEAGVTSEHELLTPEEQDALLQDIALVLAHSLPAGWQACQVAHNAVGAHTETTVRIERLDGPPTEVEWPPVLGDLFARLRAGMYRPGVGTWIAARYQLTHPVEYRVDYNNTGQPKWSTPPPAEAYAEELRRFPRDAEHIPDWMREGPAPAPADAPADGPASAGEPAFRMARLFDGLGPGQTPQVNRPPVPDDEVEALADYLTKAPVVLAARSLDNDLLDPARPAKVPLTYLTDGTWIWPGGVGYYLRTHGVPPEPELVEHIRRQHFQPREVDDYTRELAVAAIMGTPPPPRPEPPAAGPSTAEPAPPVPVAHEPEPAPHEPEPAPPEVVSPEVVSPEPVREGPIPEEPVREEPVSEEPVREEPVSERPVPEDLVREEPVPYVPEPAPAAEREALEGIRARLAEVGVDPLSYSIDSVVAGAWCMIREGDGWAVFRAERDGGREMGAAFSAAEQAGAYLLGSLLLVPGRMRTSEAPVTLPDINGPAMRQETQPARAYESPIEPLAGEPPLTLFRNVRELELAAGTEVDRVGDPAGNLTYAAGTHYSQRSLPPEWADRPYHVYRLRQPLRVLIGTAVPWFNQPGGGTGYYLPASIAQLLADGALMEIEPPAG
jgi:hypothetical protein